MTRAQGKVATPSRQVPDFVVIGAAKAGTTSLRRYLAQHPQLFLPERGEPSFFAHLDDTGEYRGPGDDQWVFVTDEEAYRALFSPARPDQVTGEISPRYLYFESAAKNMAERVPEVRIIAVLRHPVDRAYSHYTMNRSRGCEPDRSFESALARSAERRSDGWGWDWMYAEAGRYARQLRRYFSQFEPDQISVFVYEEWIADPEQFFDGLFAAIGVDGTFRPDTQRRERTASVPRSSVLAGALRRPHRAADALRAVTPAPVRRAGRRAVERLNDAAPDRLDHRSRARLHDEYFADDVAELESLLGRRLDIWTAPA